LGANFYKNTTEGGFYEAKQQGNTFIINFWALQQKILEK